MLHFRVQCRTIVVQDFYRRKKPRCVLRLLLRSRNPSSGIQAAVQWQDLCLARGGRLIIVLLLCRAL